MLCSQSEINLDNLDLSKIMFVGARPEILLIVDCNFTLNNISFYNSNATVALMSYSSGTINQLYLDEITLGLQNIMEYRSSTLTYISNIVMSNIESHKQRSVYFVDSQVLSMYNHTYVNFTNSPLGFTRSTLVQADLISISNSMSGIIAKTSYLYGMTNFIISNCGSITQYNSGGIDLTDSSIVISNSKLKNNKAIQGGSFWFFCNLNKI